MRRIVELMGELRPPPLQPFFRIDEFVFYLLPSEWGAGDDDVSERVLAEALGAHRQLSAAPGRRTRGAPWT